MVSSTGNSRQTKPEPMRPNNTRTAMKTDSPLADVAQWFVVQAVKSEGKDSTAAKRLFRAMLTSGTPCERQAAEAEVKCVVDFATVARWLKAKALAENEAVAGYAYSLLLEMRSTADPAAAQAAEAVLQWNGSIDEVAHWLAAQVPKDVSKPFTLAEDAKDAKSLLILLLSGCEGEKSAAIAALVKWIKDFRRQERVARRNGTLRAMRPPSRSVQWAMTLLADHVIMPLLDSSHYSFHRWQDWRYKGAPPPYDWLSRRGINATASGVDQRKKRPRCIGEIAEEAEDVRHRQKKERGWILGFDFADAAPGHIWRMIGKYPDAKDFRDWVHVRLKQHFAELRKECMRNAVRGKRVGVLPEDPSETQIVAVRAAEPLRPRRRARSARAHKRAEVIWACIAVSEAGARLSDSDEAVIKTWDAVDGLLVGCESGLYKCMPQMLWSTWEREYGVQGRLPTYEMRKQPPFKRRDHLSKVLGMSRNYLDKRWQLIRPHLEHLACIREKLAALKTKVGNE